MFTEIVAVCCPCARSLGGNPGAARLWWIGDECDLCHGGRAVAFGRDMGLRRFIEVPGLQVSWNG